MCRLNCQQSTLVIVEWQAISTLTSPVHVALPGQRCEVPPKSAHHVRGKDGGPCKFMVLQGVGEYDNVAVWRLLTLYCARKRTDGLAT